MDRFTYCSPFDTLAQYLKASEPNEDDWDILCQVCHAGRLTPPPNSEVDMVENFEDQGKSWKDEKEIYIQKCGSCMVSGFCTDVECPRYRNFRSPWSDLKCFSSCKTVMPGTSLLRRFEKSVSPQPPSQSPLQSPLQLSLQLPLQLPLQSPLQSPSQSPLQSPPQSPQLQPEYKRKQRSWLEETNSQKRKKIIQTTCNVKKLGSEGDSPRPLTPLSSSDSEENDEDQSSSDEETLIDKYVPPYATHAHQKTELKLQIINDKISKQRYVRTTEERTGRPIIKQTATTTDVRNTLNDHSYHLNQPQYLDQLGIQTPSESEEEIDVVTYEKPGKGKNLQVYLKTLAQQQQLQLQVQQQYERVQEQQPKPCVKPAIAGPSVVRRPRGRPPSKTPKKVVNLGEQQTAYAPKRGRRQGGRKKGRQAPSTSRDFSEDEMGEEEKRKAHNDMERQRRIDQRTALSELRLLVPETANNEKAAKVTILESAKLYCISLTEQERKYRLENDSLKRYQKMLLKKLKRLTRELATTR